MTNHLAAIREAATKILYAVPGLEGPLAGPIGDEAETILRLLDAAEKDSTCRIEPPDCDIGFYHCSNCACKISGGFRDGMFGETEWWNDPHCPGCGRRIVKEDDK